jgi:hypothetical protein
MNTVCHNQLRFESLFSRDVIADFDGGHITSDGGSLLLRELDKRYHLTETITSCLHDKRCGDRIIHGLHDIVRQRVISIALGYEDTNDAAKLRSDPALKIAAEKLPLADQQLASQPTLSRFENAPCRKQLHRLSEKLFDLYIKTQPRQRSVIVLDIDSTDDPTHGQQQLSLFHGFYDQHMYHPLLVFDGVSGFPLAAVLRPGNAHAAYRAPALLKRLIKRLKQAYPGTPILLRADAGFAVPAIYKLCEQEGVCYTIGLITNDRLRSKSAALLARAQQQFHLTGEKQRLFTSFAHRADSWPRYRRVIAKVECMAQGDNQRFVVTNIAADAQILYDTIYVQRGETENRIKELKLYLKADRLSCHLFAANQFRLLLHTYAYCLMWLLRQHLQDTQLATASFDTLRLKLLKIGARVKQSCRRVWVHFTSSYPYKELFATLLYRITPAPV